jgi:hypothetical protein
MLCEGKGLIPLERMNGIWWKVGLKGMKAKRLEIKK